MFVFIIGIIIGLIVGYLCPGTIKGWITTIKGWFVKAPPA